MTEQLDAALSYARRGWAVIPLHTPIDGQCCCGSNSCPSAGKHPRTAHGVRDATTDEATIATWWKRWPDANVGIACGEGRGVIFKKGKKVATVEEKDFLTALMKEVEDL